jgi:hypothetical protein
VPLGGVVQEVRTDGYLVTAIIHPSHDMRYHAGVELAGGSAGSPMPDYNRDMTVQQLIDLVAFLQTRYQIAPPPALHP